MMSPHEANRRLESADQELAGQVNGKPPYGHAELSTLKKLCDLMKLDLNKVIDTPPEQQVSRRHHATTTIMDIANANHMTPAYNLS